MFSVVIPLFNKAPYLQRALDSVYAQSCLAEEIIVVNDGSTDGGELIAKAQRDPRVRVIDQPHQGVSVARNAGIAAASQPYVAFLDADDEWRTGFLSEIERMIGLFPGAGLYGTGYETSAAGRDARRHGIRSCEIRTDQGIGALRSGRRAEAVCGPVDFFRVWKRRHVLHTSSMVVPKEKAQEVGGFPVGVTICEDHEFWTRLALSYSVVLSSSILTRYHVDVPGQAAEYWQKGYKENFEILPYHRFLAEKMREINDETTKGTENTKEREASALGGEREANGKERSFVMYCRKEFAKGLLQRLYWGNFRAASEFYQTLGLQHRNYGTIVKMCGWISNHPVVQPVTGSAMRVVRWIRGKV